MPTREKPKPAASGWAPAKLILFGEHAVGYGEPALGIALSRGVRVSLRPGSGGLELEMPSGSPSPRPGGLTPEALAAAVLGEGRSELDVRIELEVPPQGGLGTSAALAVALLRAERARAAEPGEEDTNALFQAAMSLEHLAHGRSSGLDPALVLHGVRGPIWFQRGNDAPQIEVLPPPPSMHFVVGMEAPHGGTAQSVSRVAGMKAEHEALHLGVMSYLGHLALVAKQSLLAGEKRRLGFAMDLAHGVLSGLGLVSPEVNLRIEAARECGALGAKMTGAGGAGGAFYALAPDERTARSIMQAWTSVGVFAFEEPLPPLDPHQPANPIAPKISV